eukprot:COSAG04_NODE_5710_length_1517_cov_1.300423_2_plen_138_part_01
MIAGSETAGFQDGPGGAALFHNPCGLWYDEAGGRLLVADSANHALRCLRPPTGGGGGAWSVTTLVGTGAAGGFGGPAAAYIGRATLHTRVRALAEEAKVAAQQKPTERALGSEEDKALQSRLRTTGKDNAPLETGGGE